jgi:hypothetical protein
MDANPVVTTTDTEIDVTDTYEETITIPGTDVSLDTVAVSVEVTARGQSEQRTMHVIDVDGEWRWMMTPDQLAEC